MKTAGKAISYSNPYGGEIFHARRDRPWDTLSLLYNGHRIFPEKSGRGVALTTQPHLAPRLSALSLKKYMLRTVSGIQNDEFSRLISEMTAGRPRWTIRMRTVRPLFRYFTPLGPRKFCAPPPLFVRIQLCVSKNNTKN
jgi:hypothetical protein